MVNATDAWLGVPGPVGIGGQLEAVAAGLERLAVRVATGEPERVAAREEVAELRQDAQALAVGAAQAEIEERDRLELAPLAMRPAWKERTAGAVSDGWNAPGRDPERGDQLVAPGLHRDQPGNVDRPCFLRVAS